MGRKSPTTVSCLAAMLITIALSGCSTRSSAPLAQAPTNGAISTENELGNGANPRLETTLNRIVVRRGKDRYTLQKRPGLDPYGLVTDIQHIRWMAIRGGTGIQRIEKEVPDPVRESVNGREVWVRFYYEPYKPEQGMNDQGHMDIVVHTSPENIGDAILEIQNPDHPEKWDIFLLQGYGPWLQKEVDILLRLATGI